MRSTYSDVVSIVDSCGGARRIAEALSWGAYPVTPDAVRKWERYGIPSVHWRSLMGLNKRLKPWDFLLANEKCQMRPARLKKLRRERAADAEGSTGAQTHRQTPHRPAPKEH